MSSIEALSVVPLPPAPPSVARSADVRAPAVAVVRETPSEQDQVQAVLARYQSAYHRLDAAAAKELCTSGGGAPVKGKHVGGVAYLTTPRRIMLPGPLKS